MKRNKRRMPKVIGCVILVLLSVCGIIYVVNSPFMHTTIYPNEKQVIATNTTINVNGVTFKLIGVKGGVIKCKGYKKSIKFKDFYIAETEVARELWMAAMCDSLTGLKDSTQYPMTNISLVDCIRFVHRLDSISGIDFQIPSFPAWLYAAKLGYMEMEDSYTPNDGCWLKENASNMLHCVKQTKPNALGIYDMIGNVGEWTMSGSDPFFVIAGGSYETETNGYRIDHYDINHGEAPLDAVGLRLVYAPNGWR